MRSDGANEAAASSYLARHYGPEGRKVSKSFDRQKDAKDWLTTVGNSKLTGSYRPESEQGDSRRVG